MWTSGSANTVVELLNAINSAMTSVGWTRYDYSSTRRVYHGTGNGTEKIYIQMEYTAGKLDPTRDLGDRIFFDGPAGFDPKLSWQEQPGSIQQALKLDTIACATKADATYNAPIPAHIITPDERFFYWLFCDTYRLIIITRHGTYYESSYLGFINPIASERQYPYPMYICGSGVGNGPKWKNNSTGSFVFPNAKSGWLRLLDGGWREFAAAADMPSPTSSGTVFPYTAHNKRLLPNYKDDDTMNQDNFLLIPIVLQTTNPVMMAGYLRGCFWISGTRDIDSERVLVIDGVQYMVFDTKDTRSSNSYFVVALR